MSNKNTEKTLRERYIANEIFLIGTLVEDVKTGEKLKILDRGANYVTVASPTGIFKKWLSEVVEEPVEIIIETVTSPNVIVEEIITTESTVVDSEFELLESGQIKLFGHETKNFDIDLSQLLIEQFAEFDDLYSKHQIIKCLDYAIQESDTDRMYDLLEKVDKLCTKQNMELPFIVEAMKNDIERKRIAEILASIADIKPSASNYKTVTDSIKALREKYQSRKQWEVLWPFFKLAQSAGLTGIMQNLPYSFDTTDKVSEEIDTDGITIEAMEENLDLLVEDLDFSDLDAAFSDADFIDEALSVETRNALSRKIKQRESTLTIKRDRAMNKSASTSVLMQRARRLAEVMLKNRIFHKPAEDLSRQEKERFESGAGKRKSLVARLAQKLVGKVRMLQNARMHHTASPASHTHDKATSHIAAASGNGAS